MITPIAASILSSSIPEFRSLRSAISFPPLITTIRSDLCSRPPQKARRRDLSFSLGCDPIPLHLSPEAGTRYRAGFLSPSNAVRSLCASSLKRAYCIYPPSILSSYDAHRSPCTVRPAGYIFPSDGQLHSPPPLTLPLLSRFPAGWTESRGLTLFSPLLFSCLLGASRYPPCIKRDRALHRVQPLPDRGRHSYGKISSI